MSKVKLSNVKIIEKLKYNFESKLTSRFSFEF